MTQTEGKPFRLGRWMYALQLLAVVGVLGALWFLDPLGWRTSTQVETPQASTDATTLGQIEVLQGRLDASPDNQRLVVDLAALYLQYTRETGDPSYYNKADALLKQALTADPNDGAALVEMGNLSLARHDFHGALEWGTHAVQVNASNPLGYGVVGDAQVELGDYDAARTAYDKMASLRPDINSYARVWYMRELYGDMDGAIQAMSLATRTGLINTEPSNWARVQLGHLYFNTARLDQAESLYQTSLQLYPDYIHALGGMGKVRAARGDYDGAIKYYKQALRQIPIPEYVIALGDVYAAAGDTASAQKQYALVGAIQQLYKANGVDTDLEIALYNADHGITPPETLTQARAAYERRPSIFAADVLAWALYQTGDYATAKKYSDEALRLGMQDALKYYHAGMIALKLGDTAKAREYLQQAITINPHFSLKYAPEAQQTLAQLGAP